MSTVVLEGAKTSWRNIVAERWSSMHNANRIKKELRHFGVSSYDLWRSGGAYLSRLLEPDETLHGVVYEYDDNGSKILVATDWRIVFLDQQPLFISEDEIPYDEISGISYTRFGQQLTVVVHTHEKDYMVRTIAQAGAEALLGYVENKTLKQRNTKLLVAE